MMVMVYERHHINILRNTYEGETHNVVLKRELDVLKFDGLACSGSTLVSPIPIYLA
jgi:hypothetical protein